MRATARNFSSVLHGWRSPAGRALLSGMVASGSVECYFPLAAQLIFEPDPTKMAAASLSMALNALGVDPGRTWKPPWRWFSPDMLGGGGGGGGGVSAFAALAARNGAAARACAVGGAAGSEGALRAAVAGACTSHGAVTLVVALYDRRTLLGDGGGGGGGGGAPHVSAVAGYHAGSDAVLLLDVSPGEGCEPALWTPLPHLFSAIAAAGAPAGAGWVCLQRLGEEPPLA